MNRWTNTVPYVQERIGEALVLVTEATQCLLVAMSRMAAPITRICASLAAAAAKLENGDVVESA